VLGIAAALCLAAPAAAGTSQPDGRVKVKGGEWMGNDVYSEFGVGQTVDGPPLDVGDTAVFFMRFQNDADHRDKIRVSGGLGCSATKTHWFVRGTNVDGDSYFTKKFRLAPGELTPKIRLEFKATGSTSCTTGASGTSVDGGPTDYVQAHISA
jgi:hypothetical protein